MKLHYRELGEGKPFVILHGLFGSSDNWQTHGKKLSEYYRVVMVDLRNHGHSAWSDDFSYQLMVQDVKELFDDLNLQDAILLGHSMGGKVAMLLATRYPELVSKLIVADIGSKFYPQHHQEILAGLNAVDFSIKPSRADVEEIMKKFIPDFGTRQFLMKNL